MTNYYATKYQKLTVSEVNAFIGVWPDFTSFAPNSPAQNCCLVLPHCLWRRPLW